MNPLTLNPLQIKLAIAGILAVAAVVSSLTAWAFFERSRYFECQATVAPIVAQVEILSDKLEQQSDAIRGYAAISARALERGEQLLAAARADAAKHAAQVARLESLLKAGSARPDGSSKTCADARREIREARK